MIYKKSQAIAPRIRLSCDVAPKTAQTFVIFRPSNRGRFFCASKVTQRQIYRFANPLDIEGTNWYLTSIQQA